LREHSIDDAAALNMKRAQVMLLYCCEAGLHLPRKVCRPSHLPFFVSVIP
jgi:hypothetical protein